MPRRFSKLRCNRKWDQTAGRASCQARASDWIAGKRSRVICGARFGACRDGRRTKGCPSCVASTPVVPRYTRTGRNWMSGGEGAPATYSIMSLSRRRGSTFGRQQSKTTENFVFRKGSLVAKPRWAMRKALLGGALSIITLAAATPATAKESGLVPPAQSTGESRQEDVQTCICRQVLTSPSASLLMMMPCFYYRTIIPKDPSGRAAHREQRLCSDTERVALRGEVGDVRPPRSHRPVCRLPVEARVQVARELRHFT